MSALILYTTEDGRSQIKLRAGQQTVWLPQLDMAERDPAAVVKESLTSAAEAGLCRVGCGSAHRMPTQRRARGQRYCIQSEAGA